MRKKTKVVIELTPEEEQALKIWAAARTREQRLVQRAKVILYSAEGLNLDEVGRRSGLSPQNASKWRKRFMVSRMDGLRDLDRPGRPPSISPERKVKVIALACTKPLDGSNSWSRSQLARKTGMCRTTVHRILTEGQIKPHKIKYWCGRSPDPEFEPKQAAILGLYLNPPANALVLSVDEKTQIQALDRTQPELPLRAGDARRLTATYRRLGTTCLLAAFAVHDGTVTGRCVARNNHQEFLKFLKCLYRKYPRKQLHIIMDNLSVHKHEDIRKWLARRRRLSVYFTPTYASWLNQVEIWFHIFTRDVIRGGIWHAKRELVRQIMHYLRTYSKERARPFKWTYTGKPLAA